MRARRTWWDRVKWVTHELWPWLRFIPSNDHVDKFEFHMFGFVQQKKKKRYVLIYHWNKNVFWWCGECVCVLRIRDKHRPLPFRLFCCCWLVWFHFVHFFPQNVFFFYVWFCGEMAAGKNKQTIDLRDANILYVNKYLNSPLLRLDFILRVLWYDWAILKLRLAKSIEKYKLDE